jgi:hypothetical protein
MPKERDHKDNYAPYCLDRRGMVGQILQNYICGSKARDSPFIEGDSVVAYLVRGIVPSDPCDSPQLWLQVIRAGTVGLHGADEAHHYCLRTAISAGCTRVLVLASHGTWNMIRAWFASGCDIRLFPFQAHSSFSSATPLRMRLRTS